MTESTISLLVGGLNILAGLIMGFFAIYGIIVLFLKKSNLNIFRGNAFIQAFCVAALFAFALEATVFNYKYYLRYFADEECSVVEISMEDFTFTTSDGTLVEPVFETGKDSAKIFSGIAFKNLNRRVTSLFVQPVFDNKTDMMSVNVLYDLERFSGGSVKSLFKGLPHENYIAIQAPGKILELGVNFNGRITQFVINKPIPFYFSGLRLFAVSCLFFVIILLLNQTLRVKTAYLLFEYKFDPVNRKQNVIYVCLVALVILYSCICAFTSTSKFFQEEYLSDRQYNKFLVDAIINGRTYLDHGNPELLLIAERPYDLRWLEVNGFKRDGVWMSDWAYYNGKHYSYFGIVPAIILYVPYTMITGEYLSNNAGIFLFIAIAIILMAMLWRFLVKKYLPNTLFVFYLLSFLTMFFASGLFGPLRFTRFYSIVSAAGFMFVIAGILLLFKSVERERPNYMKVFFACLCFALAVGCRPNLVFVSLFVPVILWRHRSLKLVMFILAPYIMVAIPLCFYNYIRFGSILDFGFKYNMTNVNTGAYVQLNLIGRVINTVYACIAYLFTLNSYSYFFPYVESIPQNFKVQNNITQFYDKGSGIINFPIVLCLFFYFKSIFTKIKPQTFTISSAFLIIAAILIFLNSWLVGHSGRYIIDFALFMIIPSLFCAWYWCNSSNDQAQTNSSLNKNRIKITYVLLTISIFVGLCLFVGSITNDPVPSNWVLYRYLQYSLGFIGGN